uniref:BTB domain-containing protein n=1 Tax=Panagrolaimus sp. JU765 TaxID=591449 RepID=A0AC34REK6_9BILA
MEGAMCVIGPIEFDAEDKVTVVFSCKAMNDSLLLYIEGGSTNPAIVNLKIKYGITKIKSRYIFHEYKKRICVEVSNFRTIFGNDMGKIKYSLVVRPVYKEAVAPKPYHPSVLYYNDNSKDVKIFCRGQFFYMHRVVFMASSDIFAKMTNFHDPIDMSGFEPGVVEAGIRFMYNRTLDDKCFVTLAFKVYNFAEHFWLKDTEHIFYWLYQKIDHTTVCDIANFTKMTNTIVHAECLSYCLNYMSDISTFTNYDKLDLEVNAKLTYIYFNGKKAETIP